MKRIMWFTLLLAGLATVNVQAQYDGGNMYQIGNTNIAKVEWKAFTNDCPPLVRYYKQEEFFETKDFTRPNTDGTTTTKGFTYDATTVYDFSSSSVVMTNVSGTMHFSDEGDSASGSPNLSSNLWITIENFADGSSGTNTFSLGPDLSTTQGLDWDRDIYNMNLWIDDYSQWGDGSSTETITETTDDQNGTLHAGDIATNDGSHGTWENKLTYSSEYKTEDLLQSFGIDSTWRSGTGGAELDIGADQSSVSMWGSRNKFLLTIPAGQKFSIPYVVHVHLNGFDTNEFPGAVVTNADYYETNTVSGVGFGVPTYYPCGKGIEIRPPYGKVNNGCEDFYQGGSADVTIGSWTALSDDKDKDTTQCTGCSDCGTIAPQQFGGMPRWWVSEPYINLWAADQPIDYITSLGEKISFKITYRQHDPRPTVFNGQAPRLPINGWNNSWYSYVHFAAGFNGSSYDMSQWTATVYEPNGGQDSYDYRGSADPTTGDQLLPMDGVAGDVDSVGFRLLHPDGSQDLYGLVTPSYLTSYTEIIPIMQDQGDSTVNLVWPGHQLTYYNGVDIGADPSTTTYEPIAPQEVGTCPTVSIGTWDRPFINQFTQQPDWTNVIHSVSNSAPVTITVGASADALLSEHIDAQGHITRFNYSNSGGAYQLQSVVDYDGKTTTIGYDANGYISSVNMPYGRTATFHYADNANAQLLSVTDAQGMSSSFSYDSQGNLNGVTTPYGTTTFNSFETNMASSTKPTDGLVRSIRVNNPDGTSEMYAYFAGAESAAPLAYPANQLPASSISIDNGDSSDPLSSMYLRDSFHWGPKQFEQLSQTDPALLNQLQPADFLLARMQHWKLESDDITVSGEISMSQDPSPDGVQAGQKTWYGGGYQATGDENLAHMIRLLPDGTTWVRDYFYTYGLLASIDESYSDSSGNESSRNLIDYGYFSEPYSETLNGNTVSWNGNWVSSISGPGFSESWGNANSDQVAFTDTRPYSVTGSYPHCSKMETVDSTGAPLWRSFNDRGQLTGALLPTGLTITNYYGTDGFLSQSIALDIQATNTYTFANGLLATKINANGLSTSYTWDNLDRLTGIAYPDGTSMQNTYTRLDLTDQKDRLGNWVHAAYDSRRRMTSFTDRNGNQTIYGYCACGGVTSIIDPQENTTALDRNLVGWVNSITFANGDSRVFTRDPLGRAIQVADSSGLTLNYAYNIQGLVTNVTSTLGTVFSATYDAADQPLTLCNADGNWVTNYYDNAERLTDQYYGAGIQRHNDYHGWVRDYSLDGLNKQTFYGYDAAGRLVSTADVNYYYTNGFSYTPGGEVATLADGNGHVTSWAYDVYGREIAKTNANNVMVETNGYDADGRLVAHWTPAKGLTQYTYDANGNPLTVTYSSGPGITATYDTLNRLTTMSDAVGNSTFTYQNFGAYRSALASETGPWAADTVAYGYSHQMPVSVTLTQPTGGNWGESFGYDSLLRLRTVGSPAGTFTYGYSGAGRQVQSLTQPGGQINNTWGAAGQMLQTTLNSDSYSYGYDANGNRTSVQRANHALVNYGYDDIGQLVSATGLEPDGATLRANENFGYAFDGARNLMYRTNNTLIQSFTVDNANALVNVSGNSLLTVVGSLTNTPDALSVNGQTTAIYNDLTFAVGDGVTLNGGLNTFTTVVTSGGLTMTNVMMQNLPASQNLSYDLNGNLISDGLHGYDYDCANELARVTVTNQWKVEYAYDGFGRRRIRREYEWQGGQWLNANETHFVYDGMNVLQERNALNAPTVTYTRGLDVSGTMGGAGGIGGLLARTDNNGSAYYHTDGNGNVTMLVDGSGNTLAKYLYDSFGNTLGMWGPLAAANTYRFSSKEVDWRTGQYYYGYRYYEPNLQRWLNQDPIQEMGGINLYGFVGNNPVNRVDPYGLYWGQGLVNSFGDWELGLWDKAFVGGASAGDPNSQAVLAQQAGLGYTPLDDGNGNTITLDNAATSVGGKVVDGAMMMTPMGEEEEGANLLRPYCEGKGHHIPPKSMFKGVPGYDPKKALAVPLEVMRRLGLDHDAISGAQNTLYNAFAKTGDPLTWDAIQQIETQALVTGGAPPGLAQNLVVQAIQALQNAGISPGRIPWN